MGRSRKRRSGGPLSDQELRRYGLFLTVPLIILVLGRGAACSRPYKRAGARAKIRAGNSR